MTKKINKKPITIIIIVIGFLMLLKFQFPHYRISSNNMLPSLQKGDIVLVNKLMRGSLKNNDICVFETKGEPQLSRIIGLPGDKVELVDGVLLVNEVEQSEIPTLFTYKVILGDHPALSEYDLLLLLKPSNQFEEYTAELTLAQAEEISKYDFVLTIKKVVHPKGYYYSFSSYPIFPDHVSFNWSRDNFGPITIPKKGDEIILGSKVQTIKNNYYFAMGDNRHRAIDSRYWGFLVEDKIIGKMITTLYSPNE